MNMPLFNPTNDPGSNFGELVKRVGLTPPHEVWSGSLDVPHATTCVALRFSDGVVIAGDRRATSGNIISHRAMEKVVQTDHFSAVAIAGAAGEGRAGVEGAVVIGVGHGHVVGGPVDGHLQGVAGGNQVVGVELGGAAAGKGAGK